MDVKIRKATLKDVNVISKIYALSWKSAYKGIVPQKYLDVLKCNFWVSSFQNWINNNILTDEIGPSYSVLNDKTKVMSDLYTSFNAVFLDFYEDMANALDSYKKDTNFTILFQNNFFIVSRLPWL